MKSSSKIQKASRTFVLSIASAISLLFHSFCWSQPSPRMVENNLEVRTTVAFKVSGAAVQKILPKGWEINSPKSGSSKDFNLVLVLINQTNSLDSGGKSVQPRSYVVLVTPAKKSGTEFGGSLVFSGFAAREILPGAYSVYLPAQVALNRQQHVNADGSSNVEESWTVKGENGDNIDLRIRFTRGTPVRSQLESKVISAANPDFYRIYKIDQASDLVRSVVTGENRLDNFSYKAAGPVLSSFFDGSEQLISISSIPYYSRVVYLP
jgi:hypothetical protein